MFIYVTYNFTDISPSYVNLLFKGPYELDNKSILIYEYHM